MAGAAYDCACSHGAMGSPSVLPMFRSLEQSFKGYAQLGALAWRMNRRYNAWSKQYKSYLSGQAARPPYPVIVQIVPTEACNLRCLPCNQWGVHGYFHDRKFPVGTMDIGKLSAFLENFRRQHVDFLLSVHGGEPFLYQHMSALLDYLQQTGLDTAFSTNGTLLQRFAPQLAAINPQIFYILSFDGGPATNDRIRGQGVSARIMENVRELRARCHAQHTGDPKLLVNYCLSEHNPDDIDGVLQVARQMGAMLVMVHRVQHMLQVVGVLAHPGHAGS